MPRNVFRIHLPPTRERESIVLALNNSLTPFGYVLLPTGDLVKTQSATAIAQKIVTNFDPRKTALFEPITPEHIISLQGIISGNVDLQSIETIIDKQ